MLHWIRFYGFLGAWITLSCIQFISFFNEFTLNWSSVLQTARDFEMEAYFVIDLEH